MFEPWQRELMETSRVARLATIARDGSPHVVPVCYAMAGEQFVIAVDEKPKRSTRLARLANIERDPRVSLLVDHYDEDWQALRWIRVDGRATVEERGGERPEAIAALRARYPQYEEMRIEALPLIIVSPERVVEWRAAPETG